MKNILEISAKKRISVKDAKKEFLLQNGNTYAKSLQKQKSSPNAKKQDHQDQQKKQLPELPEPFVPDRLQTLEFAILSLKKNHAFEMAEMRKAQKAEMADIHARLAEQDKRHMSELNQRDEIIAEKEQMIIHQEKQITELSRLVTKLEAEKKMATVTPSKLEVELKTSMATTENEKPNVNKKTVTEAVIMPSDTDTASTTASCTIESSSLRTPCKSIISKSMARSSSVKRSMSQSPGNDNNSKPSKKRDKKDSGSLERTNKQASDSTISPRTRSPSPAKRRNTSRSRSLERWTGHRDRSSHISFKIAPTPETVASPQSSDDTSNPP